MTIQATLDERKLIAQIAARATEYLYQHDMLAKNAKDFARRATIQELLTVHEEIVPLRLTALLEADNFNLMHDVVGIHNNLFAESDRKPCLTRGFLPRFAQH